MNLNECLHCKYNVDRYSDICYYDCMMGSNYTPKRKEPEEKVSDRLAYDITNRDEFGITTIAISDRDDNARWNTITIDTVHEEAFLLGKVKGRYVRMNTESDEVTLMESKLK